MKELLTGDAIRCIKRACSVARTVWKRRGDTEKKEQAERKRKEVGLTRGSDQE